MASEKPTAPKKRPKTGGRKPSADPSLVLTLRLKTSEAERLPKDWRAQAADFLRGLAS